MECFVLGTGGMMPMPKRRLTSVAVRTDGRVYLFDCGEGTQVPYKEAHLGFRPLKVVAVTHLHADHVLGLPGMLMLRSQMETPEELVLVGPPGLERFVKNVRHDLRMYINYPLRFLEWSERAGELAYEDEQARLFWRPLDHSVFCLGYRLEEHGRPGKFDPEAAVRLGVPKGPLYRQLQLGEAVVTPSGATVQPEDVLGPPRRGRHVAFCTDTAITEALQPLLRETDLAFVEGMFLPEHEAEAAEKKHMTVAQSTQAAARAKVGRLVLVHLSPRYEPAELPRIDEEAAKHHPAAAAGREGQMIEVPLPD
ncbi:MAG: ribonuclease Z [Deltaproteobacteria bacterium]|nr:ribonuclease Z [Deltaproteobacteria bacterium]